MIKAILTGFTAGTIVFFTGSYVQCVYEEIHDSYAYMDFIAHRPPRPDEVACPRDGRTAAGPCLNEALQFAFSSGLKEIKLPPHSTYYVEYPLHQPEEPIAIDGQGSGFSPYPKGKLFWIHGNTFNPVGGKK